MRICIGRNKYATIFSCYGSTVKSSDGITENFYSDLRNHLRSTSIDDKLIFLGNFNARTGCDSSVWNSAIGRHDVGKTNSNGHLLLSLYSK